MKKMMASVLCALCLVPCVVRAEVHYGVKIDDLYYNLNDSTMTAEVTSGSLAYSMTTVEIPASVTNGVESYAVTSIGRTAFYYCSALTSVSAPSVTSIGESAFQSCTALKSVYVLSVTSIAYAAFRNCRSLTSLTVNSAMQSDWDSNKGGYGINGTDVNPDVTFLTTPTLTAQQVVQAGWKTTLTVSTELKSGDTTLDKDEYEYACEFYGIEAQEKPTAEDFKVVSKDAQVVKEGEIAVTKESIEAAKAETVTVVNGQVALGVSVCSNADITASTAKWAPVKFTKDTQIGLSADGTKLILPIPVAAQQGFMILQSGDAKVSEGGRGLVIGEPWYKPTVED